MIVATDLEGVLIPEIWEEVARTLAIPELEVSSHDEPDFERLMQRRVDLLNRHDIRLPQLVAIAADVVPFAGATELLAWLRTKGQVLIVSDTFHELGEGIVQRLGGYNLFANTFRTDSAGRILGYRLRIRGRKDNVVRSLREIGFTILAMGDGWNDQRLLESADHAILFNAPDALAAEVPAGHRASNYEEVRQTVLGILKNRDSGEFVLGDNA